MAKFFAKPKASSPANVAVAGPSKLQTDFERTFKPFILGKDKVLAPTNWFLAAKRRKTEVIVIDSDDTVEDVKMQDEPSSEELNNMSPQGMFSRFCLAKFFMLDLQIVCIIFFRACLRLHILPHGGERIRDPSPHYNTRLTTRSSSVTSCPSSRRLR